MCDAHPTKWAQLIYKQFKITEIITEYYAYQLATLVLVPQPQIGVSAYQSSLCTILNFAYKTFKCNALLKWNKHIKGTSVVTFKRYAAGNNQYHRMFGNEGPLFV